MPFARTVKLSSSSPPRPPLAAALSQPPLPDFDDLYEYYDPDAEPELPPRQQQTTPQSQRRPPSTSSGSTRSLRRTQRLEERNSSGRRVVAATSRTAATKNLSPPRVASRQPLERGRQSSDGLFDKSGSTTPQSFRRIVSQESFWPERHRQICRRTHEAILFALEAIRTGQGIGSKELTADTIEENARMSDLLGGTQSAGGFQNGAARTARGGPVAVPTDPTRVPTPRDVMRARREREAKKLAEQEARQREANEQSQREQETQISEPTDDSPSQRRSATRRSAGEPQAATSSARRQENVAPSAAAPPARSRATTLDQGQPRPVSSQQSQQQASTGVAGASTRRSRNDPPHPLNISTAQPPPQASQPPPQEQNIAQQATRSGFPHAFERWETLSSHWEGLTSYWVRRLQENSNELNDKPIDRQMSRQITDLSAAGANLFHAVVELQRLRASSERKFQRWFFETRQEQERAQETQAELQRLLRSEREERATTQGSIGTALADKLKAEELVKEMRRELQISKEEARRAWEELGRREQEERERTISLRSGEPTLVGGVQVVPMTQGVPSRQTSTANRPATRDGPYPGGPGPTAMGGQQMPRRNTTTTLDSPSDEQRQFTYDPQASSPTETDPFTESAQATRPLHQEQDAEPYSVSQRPMQPPSSSAAIAAARAAQAPTTQRSTVTTAPSPSHTYAQPVSLSGSGPGSRFYQQPDADTALRNPVSSAGPPTSSYAPARPGTNTSHATDPSDQRSYIPSVASGNESELGEEEYEINPDGSYRRDAQGRRVPYAAGTGGGRIYSDDGSDEYDVTADLERERMYRERYGSLPSASGYAAQDTHTSASTRAGQFDVQQGTRPPPVAPAQTYAPEQQQISSTYSQVTTSQAAQAPQSPISPADPDYSGQGWGDVYETVSPRHQHPTRLSDILEERSAMTSPSRGSYLSGRGGEDRGGDTMGGGYPIPRGPGGR